MRERQKLTYLLKGFARGAIGIAAIVVLFLLTKESLNIEEIGWLEPFFRHPWLVYLTFAISEIMFGLLPPELYLLWAQQFESLGLYIYFTSTFAVFSYIIGIFNFSIGRWFQRTRLFRWLERKLLKKQEKKLEQYGLFLVVVAALTPVPFTGVSLLVGALNYPLSKYMLYSTSRFIRFAVYGVIIWNVISV